MRILLMSIRSLAAAFHQKDMEVRGQKLGVKLPHHQCDLTSMVSGMVRQMLHQVRQTDLCCAKRKHFSKDSFVTQLTNSTCSFSTSAHFNCTAATLGNATGLNRASRRIPKSVKKAELWDASFQYASQPHSSPMMCTSVSRTERKLPPRSRVNCSALSAETACKTLLFAQRSYL
jgi:hypothetical protein